MDMHAQDRASDAAHFQLPQQAQPSELRANSLPRKANGSRIR